MLESPVIELRSAERTREGDTLTFKLHLWNPLDQTVFLYSSFRTITYDRASRSVTLLMHDQNVPADAPYAQHLKQPHFASIPGNAESNIQIEVPAIVNRIRSAAERHGTGPLAEQLPIHEATSAHFEIAHQDTPYYYNPKVDVLTQLKQWGRAVATGTFSLAGGGQRPDTGSKPR